VIVGDYHLLRLGLRLLLENEDQFRVVGEASDFKELHELLQRVIPDIVLLDLVLPQDQVVSILKFLQRNMPRIATLVIAVNASQGAILDCVMLGVKGVIWKESTQNDLLVALHNVSNGQRYFEMPPSGIDSHVISQLEKMQSDQVDLMGLSLREQQVLKLIAEGYSYKEIGDRLSISPRTVESHKNNLLLKLNLNTQVDLVKYAMRSKLVD